MTVSGWMQKGFYLSSNDLGGRTHSVVITELMAGIEGEWSVLWYLLKIQINKIFHFDKVVVSRTLVICCWFTRAVL